MRFYTVRLIYISGIIGVIAFVLYSAYKSFIIRGFQAEARIYTAYIGVLQEAFYLEEQRFVAMENYGAHRDGDSLCQRPKGALRLGFRLGWREGVSGTKPLRYFYKVELPASDGYQVRAQSGSDTNRYSLVCFDEFANDVWHKDRGKDPINVNQCES